MAWLRFRKLTQTTRTEKCVSDVILNITDLMPDHLKITYSAPTMQEIIVLFWSQ